MCTFVGNTIHERVGLRRRLSRVHKFNTLVVMDGVHILLVPGFAAVGFAYVHSLAIARTKQFFLM